MAIRLIPDDTNISFVRMRYVAFALTFFLTIAALGVIATKGLNLGVDFKGGLTIEAAFSEAPSLDQLRSQIDGLEVGSASLQEFGNDRTIMIRLPLPQPEGDPSAVQRVVGKVRAALEANHEEVSLRRVESVSGNVSDELIRAGIIATVLSMAAVAIFTWFRFEWYFGISTLVALIHDMIMTLGFFALTQLEFNLPIIAAILTIVGYSLNDKVVVDDRIRENMRKYRKMTMPGIVDLSVNEVLPRTLMTTLTLIAALLALLVFGPDVIFGFTAAMMLGIVIGSYSSIFVSSSLLITMGVSPERDAAAATSGINQRGR